MKAGKAIDRFRAILLEVINRKGVWEADELTQQVDKIYTYVFHEIFNDPEEEVS